MRSLLKSLGFLLLVSCSSLDDQLLSKDEFKNVEINDFQINLERDYINARVLNKSAHIVTSCIFKFSLYKSELNGEPKFSRGEYSEYSDQSTSSSFIEIQNPDSLSKLTQLLSHKFFIRETLKPGYSTEVYFEINLDFEKGQYFFTKELVELKGR